MKLLKHIREHVWSMLPDRANAGQCRWAALLWGGALLALGALNAWKHQRAGLPLGVAPGWLAGAGVALTALLLLPATRSSVYLGLMRVFAIFGFIIGTVALTLGFYLVITPMGWMLRLAGKDLLTTRKSAACSWSEHLGRSERRRYYRLS